MGNIQNLNKPVPFRMESDVEAMIEAIATLRNEKKAETMRRLLRKAASEELLATQADALFPLIRRAVSEALKPAEERLAKISAKTAVAGATAMYTNLEVLGQLGRSDIRTVHADARKKAVSFVRTTKEDMNVEE